MPPHRENELPLFTPEGTSRTVDQPQGTLLPQDGNGPPSSEQ